MEMLQQVQDVFRYHMMTEDSGMAEFTAVLISNTCWTLGLRGLSTVCCPQFTVVSPRLSGGRVTEWAANVVGVRFLERVCCGIVEMPKSCICSK